MNDDLVKRLRDSCYLAFDDGTNDYATAIEAADRIEALEARVEAAESRVEAMERALTPSEETKAAYIGRFQFSFVVKGQNG